MPAYVDHALRRREVVAIAIELIAERGVEAASVRSIAERAGYSTTIVSHYFRDKTELLLLALESASEQSKERVEEVVARGESALKVLETFLPLDPLSAVSWKIAFALWGAGLSDVRYRQAQIGRGRTAQELIRRVLDECSEITVSASGGRDEQVGHLLAMITGIAALAIFDPKAWPAKRQRARLAAELKALAKA